MPAERSADIPALVSRDRALDAVRDALRLYVGRGRRYSVKQLSNATGVKDRVIECAMAGSDNGDCRPISLGDMLSIASFLGPDFTTEWLGLAQQAAFALPDASEPPPGIIAADAADEAADVVRAARDGKFDPAERRRLRETGKHMISTGAQLFQLRATA